MSYDKGQKASGIEVGDEVKVLRPAEGHEDGWMNSWCDQMDEMVGEVFEVLSKDYGSGFELSGLSKHGRTFCFPYFVLEVIEESDDI